MAESNQCHYLWPPTLVANKYSGRSIPPPDREGVLQAILGSSSGTKRRRSSGNPTDKCLPEALFIFAGCRLIFFNKRLPSGSTAPTGSCHNKGPKWEHFLSSQSVTPPPSLPRDPTWWEAFALCPVNQSPFSPLETQQGASCRRLLWQCSVSCGSETLFPHLGAIGGLTLAGGISPQVAGKEAVFVSTTSGSTKHFLPPQATPTDISKSPSDLR